MCSSRSPPLDAYRVVVQVDERDVNHVSVGQRGH
jgi:hypothetical protein